MVPLLMSTKLYTERWDRGNSGRLVLNSPRGTVSWQGSYLKYLLGADTEVLVEAGPPTWLTLSCLHRTEHW